MRRTVRPGDAPWQDGPGSPARAGPGQIRTTPYQGLRPFTEQDALFFFGREAERTILVANLMAARLTLVYGESGVGKSSILQAGVVRHLREQERDHTEGAETPRLLVVYVNEWAGDPVARLLERIAEEIARVLGDPAIAAETPPSGLAGTLAAWTGRWNLDLLIILDQFEEYFLYHRDEDGPGTFAAEFPQAVNRSDLPLTFLIGIRGDALARLDRFKGRVPNLFDNYVRIRHLRASRAEAAVVEPLRRLSELSPGEEPWTADPDLVQRVLDGVRVGGVVLSVVGRGVAAEAADRLPTDPAIETPYLQMVLTRLWVEEARQGSRRLRLQTLEALGGPQRIVRTHLDEALERLPSDQQEVAAGVFHYLVTPGGAKIGHTATDLATYTGLPEDRVRVVLDRLAAPDARILRTVAAPSGADEEPHYEIFHDVLAPAVLGWRAVFDGRRQAEAAAARQLEERAIQWRRRARIWGALLVGIVIAALAALAVVARNEANTAKALVDEQRRLRAQEQLSREQERRANETLYVARADAVCSRGEGRREAFGAAPERSQRPQAFATWLDANVAIGDRTYQNWSRLPAPQSSFNRALKVRKLYRQGLDAYELAALAYRAGSVSDGSRFVEQGGRIAAEYRALARQDQYRYCARALPQVP